MAKLSVHKSDGDKLNLARFKSLLTRRLVIPEYQRSYAWRQDDIRELYKTIRREFTFNPALETQYDGALLEPCFLGSIIFCSSDKEQKPNTEEYLVIDGQQRIISLLVILRFILYEIKKIIKKLEDSNEEKRGKDEKIVYPIQLMKRDIKDIAQYFETVKIRRNGPKNRDEEKILHYINKEQDSDSLQEIEDKILDHIKIGVNVIKEEEKIDEDETSPVDQAIFHIQLANHILNHIQFCWLYIEDEGSEEYAIDMFNIMNSTGEPLTGFDILKSTFYKMNEKLGDKATAIEENVLKLLKHNRKKFINHTGKLILLLSIYRNDKVVSEQVKEQRRYIQEICTNETTSEKICSNLESISDLYIDKWLGKDHPYKKEAGFCFNFLIDLGHYRTLPVLLKFQEKSNEINNAIKACTAFSVIWRILHDASTGGVDNKYLETYKKLKDEKPTVELLREVLKVEISREILNRRYASHSDDEELNEEREKSSDNLEKYLAKLNVTSKTAKLYLKEEWEKKLIDLPIYSKNKRLARFLILLASDKLTYEKGSFKQTEGFGLLKPDTYNNEDEDKIYKTIDHIIAQRPKTKDKAVSNVHTLGNLTLLPPGFNSSLRNSDFEEKKVEFERVIKRNVKGKIPYLPFLEEIVRHDSFGEDEIYGRTQMLSDFIWDTLVTDWLGWK